MQNVVLVIDNYDSFTYNLVQYLGEMGCVLLVERNDAVTAEQIGHLQPDRIVISPGPCTPNEAGVSVECIRRFWDRIPILGVCLGHQSIGQAFGADVVRNSRIVHGKTSWIHHDGSKLFEGCSNPFEATRYHSLVVRRQSLPDCLIVSAETAEGEVMALRHRDRPVVGVQFHPESILTRDGKQMLANFLRM